MRKIVIGLLTACLAVVGFAGSANAVVGTASGDTINYKYANSQSPDSSTCGPDWANDTVKRVYQVYPQQALDGTYRVVVQFKKGTFTTLQGVSPESCQAGDHNQLAAGITGSFHGTITMKVSGGTYSPSENVHCTANCLLSDFVTAAFGAGATWTGPDFYFKYTTTSTLACAKQWINAGTGNGGDIASICAP
jgi:hypothetical protein